MSTPPRLLVISQHFPPHVSASSVLVDNIVRYYSGYVSAIGGYTPARRDPDFVPPCPTRYLRPPRSKLARRVYNKLMPRLRFVNRALMRRIATQSRPDVIMGNYPEIEFFVSSFEVADALGIPFYAYFHDLWAENMFRLWDARMAQAWEERIIRRSARVVCCTEAQQDHYRDKYGVRCELLLHPIPDKDLEAPRFRQVQVEEKRVAFVGSLSPEMNTDALVTLSHAVASLPEEYRLYWYPLAEIPLDYLASEGLDTSRIVMRPVSTAEMRRELAEATILVAPLSFKNCSPAEVHTVFSNKVLTYLISGRPILVYGPPDSYQVRGAHEGGWGLVVNQDDASELGESIRSLAANTALQEELVQKGFVEAKRRRSSLIAAGLRGWVEEDAAAEGRGV